MTDGHAPVDLGPIPQAPVRDPVADGAAALAAARLTVTIGTEKFQLRPEFDVRALIATQRGNFDLALTLAFVGGKADVDRLLNGDAPVSIDQMRGIVQQWAEESGGAPTGES